MFTVYPNPSSSTVTISSKGIERIEIYNSIGQHIAEKDISGPKYITIDMNKYSNGLYFIKISDKDKKIRVKN